MIGFTTGNILNSDSEALVNTVNCEGYMGKGIAYQFKLRFPNNNREYIRQCKNGLLHIGDILVYTEDEKTILNFPTKDKWRKKSEYSYIEKGLETLKRKLIEHDIKSVAIPPLGCGNGGLEWKKVQMLIENALDDVSDRIKIIVYEPIVHKDNYQGKKNIKEVPKLTSSHILLMKAKINLSKFNRIRLQKTLFINNLVSGQDYFKFEAHNFGPYAYSIEILSRDIKQYQNYFGLNTAKSYEQALKMYTSKQLDSKLKSFNRSMEKSITFVNSIKSDSELELLTTILFLVKNDGTLGANEIIDKIKNWNEHKRSQFDKDDILKALTKLTTSELIRETLMGTYDLLKNNRQGLQQKST